MVRKWGIDGTASVAGAATRLFRLNEFACATLMGFGYLALHGYILAGVAFVWYAALYVLRG
jgi:hypothetical protein